MTDLDPDLAPLRNLLERISYKPGWYFRLDDNWLTIGLDNVVDANNPLRTTTIARRQRVNIPPAVLRDESMLMDWLKHQIEQMEQHELDEWLRLDGKRVSNPHPDKS